MNIIIPILQIHKQAKGGYIPVQGHTEGKWRLKPESGLPRFAFLLSHFYLTCEISVFDRQICRQPAVKCDARSRLSVLITINYSRKQRKTRQVIHVPAHKEKFCLERSCNVHKPFPIPLDPNVFFFIFLHLHRAS